MKPISIKPKAKDGEDLIHDRRGGRRGIYILPNLFTTAGLFFGFFSIIQATKGNFEMSALAIFIAMLMDGLDGRMARWTNTTSDFGAEYDSLSDVVAFGLAPALVMYEWSLHAMGKFGWLVAFLYVAAAALRLARFNTQKVLDKRYFQGIPSPAAAAVVTGWVWLSHDYELAGGVIDTISLVLTIGAALAMVSNFPYNSFKDLDLKGRISFFKLLIVVLGFVLIWSAPPLMLFLIFFVYFISGLTMRIPRIKKRIDAITDSISKDIESVEDGGLTEGHEADSVDTSRG